MSPPAQRAARDAYFRCSLAMSFRDDLIELKTDSAWQQKWLAGDKRTATEFDLLTRLAVGQKPAAPVRELTDNEKAIAGLGAPADISGYDLHNIRTPNGYLHMDEATSKLATTELLPAAHALDLSPSDVALVAGIAANPMDYDKCEASLHRLWPGDQFAAGINDFIAVRDGNPKLRALLEQYPETLGNNAALISSVVAAYRRGRAK